MLHTSLDWTPFGQLMIDFIKQDKARPGNTAKESDRNLAVHVAEIEMIARSLAYLGTAQRIEVLAPLMEKVNEQRKNAPMVEQYAVRIWLRAVREAWDAGAYKSISDEEWLYQMEAEFSELVFDESTKSTIQRYRKDLILAGLMEPTKEDEEWLTKEYESLAAVANPYQAALAKLRS